MWLSLAVALLAYLMSPKGTDKEKKQALLNAALAGGATYLATQYTGWGSDLSRQFDGLIGVGGASTTPTTAGGGASGTAPAVKMPTTTTGTWGTLRNWAVGGLAIGAGSSAVSKLPPWVLWAAIGLGAYLLLKD